VTALLNRDPKKKTTKELRVVIYARASQDRRGRMISVESQVTIGQRWCAQHGLTVVAVLRDNDMSASRFATKERPEYKEALRLLASGEANVLWTWENSRAQRDLDVFVGLRQILTKVGGYWVYDDHMYDMSDPDDRIEVAEDAIESEKESAKISKRSRRGVETRALNGLWHGSLSFGYRNIHSVDTGEVVDRVIDAEQGPVAAELVDALLSGIGPASMAHELNRRGVLPARALRWTARHVTRLHRILRDPITLRSA
jgi:site-specific DNA recombinase